MRRCSPGLDSESVSCILCGAETRTPVQSETLVVKAEVEIAFIRQLLTSQETQLRKSVVDGYVYYWVRVVLEDKY